MPPFYSDDAVTIWHGNALDLPLEDESVDLCVTSPPYFGLRAYADGGETYSGQIGSEATPGEFLDALTAATREMARVLKPTGSIFVNLGDKYAGGGGHKPDSPSNIGSDKHPVNATYRPNGRTPPGTAAKSLMLLPERYRIRCVDDLGLIARAVIVWCLSGGAKVYARTPTGDRPVMLRDLVRSYRAEDVQLWNGEKWTQVLGWGRTPDDDGALEFELRSGERIGCTATHQWPTSRGVIRADEVRVGDVIDSTRLPEPDAPRMPAMLPDEDIGWLVGLYIAEGSRSETTVQIAGHVREEARHARLKRIAEALDASFAIYQTNENTVTANMRGSVLSGVLDRYVSRGTAKTKRLQMAAWQRSDAFLAAVVEGYLSGDGHYDAKNDRWRLGFTENDEWAADLRTLAARLGTVLRLRRHQHTGSYGTFPGWRGEWRWTRSTHHNAKADGEVVAIRQSRARDFYDLSVADEPHLFALASGILTHNCKPNGLPESVRDRVRRSHEDWVHLTKEPRYFTGIDEIREPHLSTDWIGRAQQERSNGNRRDEGKVCNTASPLGKLPGSVWTIPTQPLRVPPELGIDHFASFPMEWPRRVIRGWSPSGICVECGEGRRPVVARERRAHLNKTSSHRGPGAVGLNAVSSAKAGAWSSDGYSDVTLTAYACACDAPTAPTRPAVILDPFGGTGTTGVVAKALGRRAHLVDLSADYCRLAQWRVNDPKELAKAAQVKPPVKRKAKVTKLRPAATQESLLGGEPAA